MTTLLLLALLSPSTEVQETRGIEPLKVITLPEEVPVEWWTQWGVRDWPHES